MDTVDGEAVRLGSLMPEVRPAVGVLLAALTALIAGPGSAGTVVNGAAIADEKQGANWLSPGRTYAENHFSPLKAINTGNVQRLGLAWYLDLPDQGALQATPLAVDGTLYFSGTGGAAYAVDARSGKLRWQFDPDYAHHPISGRSAIWGANRGVAFWRGRVYVGTLDGRLLALDARNGRRVWSVQTFDEADANKVISGAPRVFRGKVIIGHGGEAGTRGYVTAYDTQTGEKLWRFYTVPGDPADGFENPIMAMAAQTWTGEWWKGGGNASAWDSIVFDPDLNRIYLGTANGTPIDANLRGTGGGDNLFVASIIALDADTGQYLWHYQVNPGETWDYDATEPIVLADLPVDGKSRKVLMQAPKNGFFYVIDRVTGKLISAQKISKATWADRIDPDSGRPVEASHIHFSEAADDAIVIWPSVFGAHNWQPMSFDPDLRLMFIPVMKLGMRFGSSVHDFSPQDPDDGSASLLAWDPVSQQKRWEVQHGSNFWNGGTLATAGGLVFQGLGDGQFNGYRARDGQKLWGMRAGLGINAAPMTYSVDGVQYVSVLVGYGGTVNVGRVRNYGWHYGEQPRRLITFALDGHTALPPGNPPRFTVNAIDDPAIVINAGQAAAGAKLFPRCAVCHGIYFENIGAFARDLRESTLALPWEVFRAVVRDGVLMPLGMPRYGDNDISDDDLRDLYQYVRARARDAANSRPPP